MVRTATTMALLGALCTFAAHDALAQDKGRDKRFVIAAPGIPPVFASAIFYVADKEGMFKKYGINVEVRPFETGATASRAVVSGDIEMSLSPTALLISQVSNTNAPIVAVYGLGELGFPAREHRSGQDHVQRSCRAGRGRRCHRWRPLDRAPHHAQRRL